MAGPHRRSVLQGAATCVAVGLTGCANVAKTSNGQSTSSDGMTERDPVQLCGLAVRNDDEVRHEISVQVERHGRTILDQSTTVDVGEGDRPVADELPVQATRVRGRVDDHPWRVFGLARRQSDALGLTCTVQDYREVAFSSTDGCD